LTIQIDDTLPRPIDEHRSQAPIEGL
jgi:hypothetical protein